MYISILKLCRAPAIRSRSARRRPSPVSITSRRLPAISARIGDERLRARDQLRDGLVVERDFWSELIDVVPIQCNEEIEAIALTGAGMSVALRSSSKERMRIVRSSPP